MFSSEFVVNIYNYNVSKSRHIVVIMNQSGTTSSKVQVPDKLKFSDNGHVASCNPRKKHITPVKKNTFE